MSFKFNPITGQLNITEWEKSGSGVKPLAETITAVQLPTMTTTQRNALTPVNGMVIFNSTTGTIQKYESAAWGDFGSADLASFGIDGGAYSDTYISTANVDAGVY